MGPKSVLKVQGVDLHANRKQNNNDMKLYFITTKHLENKVWFREDKDFKIGMNKVALVSALMEIRVFAFTLMSNHVHFLIACGSRDEADLFITTFKNQYSRYVRHKYCIKELLRRNEVDIQEIENSNEAVERVIAYIQMNCVAANICAHPLQYPWGTGACFFTEVHQKGTPLGNLSRWGRVKLLHSRQDIPETFLLGEEGYILPESYIDIDAVEGQFSTPKRYNYFLNSSSKAKKKLSVDDAAMPSFKDQIIISAIPDLANSLFQKSSISHLSFEEQTELLKQLRYRFSCNIEQLSRTTGLSYEDVAKMLDCA